MSTKLRILFSGSTSVRIISSSGSGAGSGSGSRGASGIGFVSICISGSFETSGCSIGSSTTGISETLIASSMFIHSGFLLLSQSSITICDVSIGFAKIMVNVISIISSFGMSGYGFVTS